MFMLTFFPDGLILNIQIAALYSFYQSVNGMTLTLNGYNQILTYNNVAFHLHYR